MYEPRDKDGNLLRVGDIVTWVEKKTKHTILSLQGEFETRPLALLSGFDKITRIYPRRLRVEIHNHVEV